MGQGLFYFGLHSAQFQVNTDSVGLGCSLCAVCAAAGLL